VEIPVTDSRTSYQLYLGPHSGAAPFARLALLRNLSRWGLTDLLEDASLVTSELVTNAAKLGEVFRLLLTREDAAVLIEVFDSSEDDPVLADTFADSLSEHGRGLMLVDALATEWGVSNQNPGKSVWARVAKN
jgi:anti-sigma regulatory factor (Ser/Thr protein kinase)